jgi:hypothetical protein
MDSSESMLVDKEGKETSIKVFIRVRPLIAS